MERIFVNRKEERRAIENICLKIKNGEAHVVWVEGEAGVGKTYLVKKMIENIEEEIFIYANNSPIYKCNENNHTGEFAFISNVLVSLKERYPRHFNKIVTDYYSALDSVSIKESIVAFFMSMPKLSNISLLLNKHSKAIEEGKNQVKRKMENVHLISCFKEIIMGILVKEKQNIVFCVDDIIWMDHESYATISSILESNFYGNHKINISFFITTRSKIKLNDMGKSQYSKMYRLLADYINVFRIFNIKNFNKRNMQELIDCEGRNSLEEYIDGIYEITKGNPFELDYTLKFSNEDIIAEIYSHNNELEIIDQHCFSENRIILLQKSNIYIIHLIAILSIIEFPITQEMISALFVKLHSKINIEIFEEAMQILINENIITCNREYYSITHDTIKTIIKNYLYENGDYKEIVNNIADALLENKNEYDGFSFQRQVSVALDILSETDPLKGFSLFAKFIKGNNPFNQNIMVSATKCFCSHNGNFTNKEYINTIAIDILLESLVEYGNLSFARRICDVLYKNLSLLEINTKVSFLSHYTKILIDTGCFENEGDISINYSANHIFDELLKIELYDNDAFNRNLLGMSLYEHQGKLKEINVYYNNASRMLEKETISDELKAKYYRNHGLIKFHAELENEYTKAIYFSKKIQDTKKRQLVMGTCYNNLGLCYFYSGRVEEALSAFKESERKLASVDYDLVRVLNNISICELFLGQIETAYDYIIKAKTQPMKGLFEEASVDINLSIIAWKKGDRDTALSIINNYVKEYKNVKTRKHDGWIYSSALLNKGYYNYCVDDFFEAIKYYKESMFYTSRFADQHEKSKRKQMIKICFEKSGMPICNVYQIENTTIDENSKNYYQIPFTVDLLAFYVI